MKSTMYLFGVPRSYYEPEISILAKRRIDDASKHLKELSMIRDIVSGSDLEALAIRYAHVEAAKKHWTDILNEE